jgi:hypothetical protein
MKRRILRLALFFSVFLSVSATTSIAQCRQWDVGGKWTLTQAKNTVLFLNLSQNGNSITGQVTNTVNRGGKLTTYTASVDGSVNGNSFNVQMYWSGETIGVYNGTINNQGRIEGTTHDRKNPSAKVNWFSNSFMRCSRR